MFHRIHILILIILWVVGCNSSLKLTKHSSPKQAAEMEAETETLATKLTSDDCTDPDLDYVFATQTFMLCDASMGVGTYTPPTLECVPEGDKIPPKVESIIPLNGAADVILGAIVTVTFDEDIDSSTVTDATAYLFNGSKNSLVTGVLTTTAKGILFQPAADLYPMNVYQFHLTGVKDSSGNAIDPSFTSTFRTGLHKSRVSLLYNNSIYDGFDAGASAADDGAIAPNLFPLVSGKTASFENYSNYSRGINGVVIDIASLPGTPTAADLEFKVGNDSTPGAWGAAPAPSSVTVRPSAAADGSSRITVLWADNAIEDKWVEITVKPTAETGLATAEVYYFGHQTGETCNLVGNTVVNFDDTLLVNNNPSPSSTINSRYDIDRDGDVDLDDRQIVFDNPSGLPPLELIIIP